MRTLELAKEWLDSTRTVRRSALALKRTLAALSSLASSKFDVTGPEAARQILDFALKPDAPLPRWFLCRVADYPDAEESVFDLAPLLDRDGMVIALDVITILLGWPDPGDERPPSKLREAVLEAYEALKKDV